MVSLTIDNSTCHVHGLATPQFNKLRELMSYRVPSMGVVNYKDPRSKRHLMTKRGDFPTGLLYIAWRFFAAERIKPEIKDRRLAPIRRSKPLQMTLAVAPYPEQEKAAYHAYICKRGIIVMPTGMGKSLVAALIVDRLQVNTIIVVPSLEIKSQLTASLASIFGSRHVGDEGKAIWVANVDSLDPKKPAKGYDCVIVDEFHHSGAETYQQLNKYAWAGVYYKIGLTATPFRSQDHERLLLESVLSKTIYKVDYQHAVAKGYIVPMEAYYVELPPRKTEGYNWQAVYKELVVNNLERNQAIMQLLDNLNAAGLSALCLIKEIAHGKILSYPFANGQDKDSKQLIKKFNERKLNVLVGTTGVLGEGVDTKPCEYVIIAGLGKSRNAFHQQIGRAFRVYPGKETCKIILFSDKSHRWAKAHFKEQCRILKDDFGVIPVKL
jgi:superfamily II DNA or RNA helicase